MPLTNRTSAPDLCLPRRRPRQNFEDADFENVDLSADDGANGLFGGGVEVPAQLLRIGAGASVVRDPDTLPNLAASMGEDPFPPVLYSTSIDSVPSDSA